MGRPMLLTSSASPGNQHRGDVFDFSATACCCDVEQFSALVLRNFLRADSKNLSIRGINVPRVMRPTGVALPSFLKARQVLAGWGDALKSRDLLGVAASATASVLVLWPQATFAQSNSGSASQSLPSVVVTSPEKRTAATTTRRSPRPAAQSAAASRRPQPKREAGHRSSRIRAARSRVTSPAARWRAPRPIRRSCRRRSRSR